MEIRDPEGTRSELRSLLIESLGRTLLPIEDEILDDVIAYPDEKRIAYLEMMKELINKHTRIK
ncbi:hypothetical protein [Peribacillus sp. SCS-155]|uniref:hypothetical protein n=1 Tax=Peribacillus sedimenti TaxID=3115297 RepID=UPI003906114A